MNFQDLVIKQPGFNGIRIWPFFFPWLNWYAVSSQSSSAVAVTSWPSWFSWRNLVEWNPTKWNIWSNYSDLTRPHPKWWFSKGNPLISGKPRLVKYYNLARNIQGGQRKAVTLPETNSKSPWKWMVGIRPFPIGFRPIFRCELLVLGRV